MTTYINRNVTHAAATYYRQAQYTPPPPRPVADVRDDYESMVFTLSRRVSHYLQML